MSQKIWRALLVLLVTTSCARASNQLVVEHVTHVSDHITLNSSASRTSLVVIDTPEHGGPTTSDVLRLIEIRRHCGRQPERCAFGDVAVSDGPYDRALRALMRQRIELGLRTRAGDGGFRPTVVSIERHGPHEATVHTCVFDALVLYDTKTIPGAHIVFDDHAVSIISSWSMHEHEGRWKWYSEDETRFVPLRDTCS